VRPSLGTLLRQVYDEMEAAIASVYADRGLTGYRPRFSPAVRALAASEPMAIRDIARATGVTHSAASQTVTQMSRAGFVSLTPGPDARERLVRLTARARAALPLIEAEWQATERAVAELGIPVADVLDQVLRALRRKPFRDRIDSAWPDD
jgi:DNA-binding MarR family transcriptional regulator